jgi:hypothetical protein
VLPPVTPPMVGLEDRFLSKTQTQGSRKEIVSALAGVSGVNAQIISGGSSTLQQDQNSFIQRQLATSSDDRL